MRCSQALGNGRTAMITAASRGLGTLIAREIAAAGGHVVLTGRSAADLRAMTAELTAAGADASFSAWLLILDAIRDAGQGQRMLDDSGMKASGFRAPPSLSHGRW
jgi:NADP-dependent 3-hydroxy acid dehydrogenase YdfG